MRKRKSISEEGEDRNRSKLLMHTRPHSIGAARGALGRCEPGAGEGFSARPRVAYSFSRAAGSPPNPRARMPEAGALDLRQRQYAVAARKGDRGD